MVPLRAALLAAMQLGWLPFSVAILCEGRRGARRGRNRQHEGDRAGAAASASKAEVILGGSRCSRRGAPFPMPPPRGSPAQVKHLPLGCALQHSSYVLWEGAL